MGFLDEIDGLVCDLDGVVYRGDAPIQPAIDFLRSVRDRVGVVYCTNNSGSTPEMFAGKLERMGLDCSADQIITSATVAGEVLEERNLAGRSAYVIGEEGVRHAVESAGLTIVPPDVEEADVVVVGIDRAFGYDALNKAARVVRSGALFIATNDDATYPAEVGLDPGAGALLAAVEAAAGRRAEVLGKPHKPMMETAARRFPAGSRLAMVGDRPDTDLDGAREMGWRTILVLSGVTGAAEAAALDPGPDLVLADLGRLNDA